MSYIMYDVKFAVIMSVTAASALFETNFIILPSFSLCHVKAAIVIKRAARNS